MYYIIGGNLFRQMKLTRMAKWKINTAGYQPITFNDVAGNKEEKEELQEIVGFLKKSKTISNIGSCNA